MQLLMSLTLVVNPTLTHDLLYHRVAFKVCFRMYSFILSLGLRPKACWQVVSAGAEESKAHVTGPSSLEAEAGSESVRLCSAFLFPM